MTTFIPEEHIGRLIVRARSLLSQNLYHELNAAGINITSEQWGILTILLEEEGITQTQLAERAYKDKPTTTRMLTLMEKRGYIRRQRDESDRRAHLVFLNTRTNSGKILLFLFLRKWTARKKNYLWFFAAGRSSERIAAVSLIKSPYVAIISAPLYCRTEKSKETAPTPIPVIGS